MPDKQFLEEYPLYRKFEMELPDNMKFLVRPPIHMFCQVCKTEQTFNMVNHYYQFAGSVPGGNPSQPPAGAITRASYCCESCKTYHRYFMLKFDQEAAYVMKVGQEPPWDITPDKELVDLLGSLSDEYKKGLVCESQSYGIGTFAYYRRIVEEIIDDLINDIQHILSDEELARYSQALEQVKSTKNTQEKIDLVKDLLPPVLRPEGMNPLSALHANLSIGIHQQSDDRCMEMAAEIREILIFLVNQVVVTKAAKTKFTDSMRKLLDKKSST
jgi:hypothetical protein